MITFQTSADIGEDRRVVLTLPPETPVGEAELMVTIAPREAGSLQPGKLRRCFGMVHSGDPQSGDADRIDADLARAYDDPHHEAT